MSYYPQFGALLNKQLARLDRTAAWLARRLGVNASTISHWLNDGARPGTPEAVAEIADVLGMNVQRDKLLAAAGYGYQENSRADDQLEFKTSTDPLLAGPSALATTAIELCNAFPPRHNLPQSLTPFVGRAAEVEQLTQQLRDPACRLLSLVGPGGIGKTRLAIEVAGRVLKHKTPFADGLFFVSLIELNAPDQLPFAIAEVLELAIESQQGIELQLLNYLRSKDLLLLLDNFEHLQDGVEWVNRILATTLQVKILVTSRAALGVPSEWFYQVGGLEAPQEQEMKPEELDDYDSIRLFQQCAERASSSFDLTSEAQHVAQICRMVDGTPLAIELAAAWLRLLPCTRIVQELEQNATLLTSPLRNPPVRHRSMHFVLEQSWQMLTGHEREVMEALALFQGGFDDVAAIEVARTDLLTLASLVQKAMIRPKREQANLATGRGRYSIHELLRQFAQERLEAVHQKSEEAHERHCTYYTTFLQHREARLKGRDDLAAVTEVEAEIENIRSAWRWAIAHCQVEQIERSVEALWVFYLGKSMFQEGITLFGLAADSLFMDDPAGTQGVLLSTIMAIQGLMLENVNRYVGAANFAESASTLFDHTLAIADKLGARRESTYAYYGMGTLAYESGKIEDARQFFSKALTTCTELQDLWSMMNVLQALGMCDTWDGNYQRAVTHHRQAIAICEDQGNLRMLGDLLCHLGDTLRILGDYEGAKQTAQKSLTVNTTTGTKRGVSWSLQLLGEIAWHQGDHVVARQHAEASLALWQEMGLTRAQAAPFILLGKIACTLGDLQQARSYFYTILESYLKNGTISTTWRVAEAIIGMAAVLSKEGKMAQAVELLHLVQLDPTAGQETKNRAAKLLAEVAQIAPGQVEAPVRSLRDVIAELLSK